MDRWLIFFFAVFGAFILLGFSGAYIGMYLKISEVSLAGFMSAFGVVNISYLAAPRNPKLVAIIVFSVGVLVAWFLFQENFFPVKSNKFALNIISNLPLWATIFGGLLSLLIVFLPFKYEKEKT